MYLSRLSAAREFAYMKVCLREEAVDRGHRLMSGGVEILLVFICYCFVFAPTGDA